MRHHRIIRAAAIAASLAFLLIVPAALAQTASTVVWPLSATTTPDAVDKPYGFRVLCSSCSADFHRGFDFKAARGTAVHALFDGDVVRVRSTEPSSGDPLQRWGRFVVVALDAITLPDGTVVDDHKIAYLHLDSVEDGLEVGDPVAAGDVLGTVGNSGVGINTVHLHLDYYQGSEDQWIRREEARDPLRILPYQASAPVVTLSKVSDDQLRLVVEQASTSLDTVGFRVEHDGSERTIDIDFDEKEGINMVAPEYEDLNPYDGTTFAPKYFRYTHTQYELTLDFDGDWSDASDFTVTLTDTRGGERIYTFESL